VDLQLVQYAGAAGDFNAIHWNPRVAVDVGLPDVIAHGMFTMASALRIVTDWLGDPGRVKQYEVRFTRPVIVGGRGPDGRGILTLLEASSLVKLLEEKLGVSAAAAAVAAAPAAGGGAAAAAPAEEKTEFTVVLTAAGANKITFAQAKAAAATKEK